MDEKMPNRIGVGLKFRCYPPDGSSHLEGEWHEGVDGDDTEYLRSSSVKEHTKKMIDDLKTSISESVCKPICGCKDMDACVSIVCKIRKIIQHYEQQEENDE